MSDQKKLHEQDPEKYSDDDSDENPGADEVDGATGGDDDSLTEEFLRDVLQLKLTKGNQKKDDKPKVLEEVSFEGIVKYIKDGKAKKIITMCGAGISTSAGIPDFRSPGTGLYDNLQKYNLPDPQAIFSIKFFRENPDPFFHLAKELYPGNFDPTPCHFFIKLLAEKGLLLRHYTQNIDTLERVAGIPGDKIVEAHGTFHSAHCIKSSCRKEYSQEFVKEMIFKDEVPKCKKCGSTVKPDIVFFGEQLPDRFYDLMMTDFSKCDLLIIMGTSLTVQPFASLVDRVPPTCPRLLINLTKAGDEGTDYLLRLMGQGGLDFDSEDCYRDVAKLGTCDDGCWELAKALGWKEDLEGLISQRGENSSSPKGAEGSKL